MAKNNSLIQSYLFFEGRCEEAIEFYKRALGAEVGMLMRFKDSPERPPGMAPGSENKIMHAQVTIGQSVVLMSDGQCSGRAGFSGFQLSLTSPSESEAEKQFAALADGGKVMMPLAKTFFASKFGMLED
ncbi:MAG: VOC family protein, partial [Limisphaerales bacterium]